MVLRTRDRASVFALTEIRLTSLSHILSERKWVWVTLHLLLPSTVIICGRWRNYRYVSTMQLQRRGSYDYKFISLLTTMLHAKSRLYVFTTVLYTTSSCIKTYLRDVILSYTARAESQERFFLVEKHLASARFASNTCHVALMARANPR